MTNKVYSEIDTGESPLEGVSEDELHALVDEVLRTGKNRTIPARPDGAPELSPDRFHARVIAAEMRRLATTLSGPLELAEDVDEWWFEVDEKRLGPISLHKARYLWEEGVLTPDSLCWHEGFSTWVFIHKVSELAEALAPRGAALPKPQPPPLSPPPSRNETTSDTWQPSAGAAMQTAKSLKLAAARREAASIAASLVGVPAAEPAPAHERDSDAEVDVGHLRTPAPVEWSPSTSGHAGTFAPVAAIAPAAPAEKPRRFAHSLVTGLAAGVVIAGALVALRVFLPETAPQPTVVVLHDPSPAADGRANPANANVKRTGAPEGARPAVVASGASAATAAVQPKPSKPVVAPAAAHAETKPASPSPAAPAPAADAVAKPKTVDSAFDEQFAHVPRELEKSEILEVVAAHRAEIDACGKQLAAHEDSVRLVMRWNVSLDGQVSDIAAGNAEPTMAPTVKCLKSAIAGWTFPKHEVPHGPVELPFVY